MKEADLGVRRIPVRTRFITGRVGLAKTIEEAIVGLRRTGDIIALSESAVAAGQGRIRPARAHAPGAHGHALPVRRQGRSAAQPEGCKGRSWQCGRGRVARGRSPAGPASVFRQKGWFYRVAGPPAAMIDDVAACLPPLDHHLIFGPGRPATPGHDDWRPGSAARWPSSTPTTALARGSSADHRASTTGG